MHGCVDRLPWTARDPLVDRAERPRNREFRAAPATEGRDRAPSDRERPSAHRPASAAAPCAMTAPHAGTCVSAYVDTIASTFAGKSNSAASDCTRLTLLQPLVSIRRSAWASIASVRSTPTIRPRGPMTSSISEKFRPVPQAMSTTLSPGRRPERPHRSETVRPLRVARRGVEPGRDVVVFRLPAVCRDQALLRGVDLSLTMSSANPSRPAWRTRPQP